MEEKWLLKLFRHIPAQTQSRLSGSTTLPPLPLNATTATIVSESTTRPPKIALLHFFLSIRKKQKKSPHTTVGEKLQRFGPSSRMGIVIEAPLEELKWGSTTTAAPPALFSLFSQSPPPPHMFSLFCNCTTAKFAADEINDDD
ncbi:hypothetical protein ACP275_12G029100 [Erythranthe tilingii]